jgi:short-subunit dehydrogenase
MAEQRTIVITGASDGIGAAAARQLTGRGDDVVLVGRSPDKTKRLAVVQTSSAMAKGGHLDAAELGRPRRRSATGAYSDTKLANILFTNELHRRHHGQGLSAVAFHPGAVSSNFGSGASALVRHSYRFR